MEKTRSVYKYNNMESRKKSLLKSLSWRILATLITGVIAWFLTGNMVIVGSIMSIDFVVKFIAYYLHERLWSYHK